MSSWTTAAETEPRVTYKAARAPFSQPEYYIVEMMDRTDWAQGDIMEAGEMLSSSAEGFAPTNGEPESEGILQDWARV